MSVEFESTPLPGAPAIDLPELAARRTQPIAGELRPAFRASGAATLQLARLFEPGALCVTTGQQPGMFTGPLFTVYKALSAVALARSWEQALGRPVVPVFWVAGDDHDFAEANHIHLLTTSGDVERLELRPRAPDAPLTPLYQEPVGPEISGVLTRLRDASPETEFKTATVEWLERHYRPEVDLSTAFAGALAELLGHLGLVLFLPTAPEAKRLAAPWIARTLREAGALDQALHARARELAAEGKPVPVPVGDAATPVMIEASGGRDRLLTAGNGFVTRRSGERWTLADLEALLGSTPTRFRPTCCCARPSKPRSCPRWPTSPVPESWRTSRNPTPCLPASASYRRPGCHVGRAASSRRASPRCSGSSASRRRRWRSPRANSRRAW